MGKKQVKWRAKGRWNQMGDQSHSTEGKAFLPVEPEQQKKARTKFLTRLEVDGR